MVVPAAQAHIVPRSTVSRPPLRQRRGGGGGEPGGPGGRPGRPRRPRAAATCAAAARSSSSSSLRQHQADLAAQVLHARGSLPSIVAAVDAAAHAVAASPDWVQLQAAFQEAARRRHQQQQQQQQEQQQQQQQAGWPALQQPAGGPRTAGSSPWGFALRQARPPAPPPPAISAPQQQQPKQQQLGSLQPCWEWQAVRQFRVLGLGSISALLDAPSPVAHASAAAAAGTPAPPRLGFRLMQLALAVALRRTVLTGLASPPLAFDPEFDPEFDAALLAALGFEVPAAQPVLAAAAGRPTLLYMPCCPRELYDDIAAANRSQLGQLTILGTSMRSHTDSSALVAALAGGSGSAVVQGAVATAYQDGRVVEVACPDCAAHGVGVSVHMFT